MKRFMTSLSVILVVASATIFAQEKAVTLRANIPFDFVVNGETNPAGEYDFSLGTSGVLKVQSRSGKTMFFLQFSSDDQWAGAPNISFVRMEGTHFLSAISDARIGVHRVAPSEAYKKLEKQASAQTVTLAAK